MATYETFAAVYDAVMDDSLYDLWTDFSLRHLPKSKDRKKLLELACGTGIQSVRFSQAGFDVTGLDLSADMLKIAEKRGIKIMSSQAVGGAVGWNPICIIIPCHRVVGINGSLTGYGGGIKNKIELLKLEGNDISKYHVPKRGTAL